MDSATGTPQCLEKENREKHNGPTPIGAGLAAAGAAMLTIFALLTVPPAHAATPPVEHATIQGPFTSVSDVTAACLQCHPQAGTDILESVHWRWQRQRMIDGKTETYAKLDGLSNFGIVAGSNPGRCLNCHVSISPSPETIGSQDALRIDCLVCHDTSGAYRRNGKASATELLRMARSAGRPGPANCMTCHAPSCGLGNGLQRVDFAADVHFSRQGGDLSCQDCHPGGGRHRMARRISSKRGIRAASGCRACHTDSPHRRTRLNRHAELIACQTCHIPDYGRTKPVLIGWNWLLAGKRADIFLDATGDRTPLLTGNGFTLGSDVIPVYRWDNGSDRIYRRGDRVTPGRPTVLQGPGPRTPGSRIRPFMVQYGTQLYDARYRYLISPQLSDGSGALFPATDWETIARTGMNSFRLPYSGRHDFTITVTYRRLDHGTVPAARALDCMDCHGASGRMNWQALGYEQDPWTDERTDQAPATVRPQSGPAPVLGKELPPVRETILPVVPDR